MDRFTEQLSELVKELQQQLHMIPLTRRRDYPTNQKAALQHITCRAAF